MNKQNKHYQQLTQAARYQIWALRDTGKTIREIALSIDVHPSTVSRELKRNRTANGYDPMIAHTLSDSRRKQAKKADKRSDNIDKIIHDKVLLNWSPKAISLRIEQEMDKSDWQPHHDLPAYRRK